MPGMKKNLMFYVKTLKTIKMISITKFIGKKVSIWRFGSWCTLKFISLDKHGYMFLDESNNR